MKNPLILVGCLAGCLVIAVSAKVLAPRDPACVRIQAKADLAEEFCDNLSQKAAKDKCSTLAEDPVVMGQCMHVVVPMAHSSCMAYLNMDQLHEQVKELCK